ncbi:thioredoxin domain-containing protein [Halosegnis marinus]|uniref:Thioredoxin domain-containing protein n=1 Tax=Halosegnis marinus TaxID=3034023 RepID=A0ABD5ZKQ6_9EURY|nr:thioredoxin domain-containing protein [Halosegnis sp. DT85]
MTADPLARNRLDEEASPYLRQHADNPVHWQPWDDAALDAARERDRPIFLSVGYSSCHWCHVMAEESFEDEGIAATLNESFVPVKVDREERPDLDSLYITVCRLVRGQAGWPLTVFCTPEGKPFFVGTYFPPEAKRNQPGFRQLVEHVAAAWDDPEEREEIEARAEQWTAAARGELEDVPDAPGEAPDAEFLDGAAASAVRGADRDHGGFGRGQKFPNPPRVDLLLRAADRTGTEVYADVARETLDAMAAGGLHDHLGGGFHRYCTDPEWVVPHFEKMLYDQAGLVRTFLAGHQLLGEERYADAARGALAFVERDLTHEDGGFFSTLDARSPYEGQRVEGAYYVWTPEDVRAAVGDDTDADLFAARYGVTEAGNFEPEQDVTGSTESWTVLTESASVASLAAEFDLPEDEVEERLDRATDRARDYRAERPAPNRDEKVLAGWNGLMVSAFAEAGIALDERYAEVAADALGFVRERLWDGERLSRRWKDSDVKGDGYLEDYAFLARGALNTYEATGDADHLAFALDLARALVRDFYDDAAGTLYFTPAGGESLVARPQELGDSSTPSSTGVAVETLDALSHFTTDDTFAEVAETVVETHASTLESDPLQHAAFVLAADALAVGRTELTVAADGLPDAWRATLAERYLPLRLLSVRPPTDEEMESWLDRLGLDEAPPIWNARGARDGPTVYACRNRACSPPRDDLAAALDWQV